MLFTKGSSEDKMRIIFDMCDKDDKGVVDKKELKEMLTSLIEIAKTEKIPRLLHTKFFSDVSSVGANAHDFPRLFEAATRSDTAWRPRGVPRTTHELVWSEKTATQKTVPAWSRDTGA